MHEVNLDTWESFEDQLKALSEKQAKKKQQSQTHVSGFLFRGHTEQRWRLTTSLERYTRHRFSLEEYYLVISAVKPQVETFTGKRWEIPTPPEFASLIKQRLPFLLGGMPAYEYMVHLRHHGFPSPLLDWTRSPYIAAYFAFEDARDDADKVSVFVYWEYVGSGKVGSSNEPTITSLGPYTRGHQRHFLQQSEYTVCTIKEGDTGYYTCHEQAFAHENFDQDLLWKFISPQVKE